MAKKIALILLSIFLLGSISFSGSQRVISTTPAITEILLALGLKDNIVAVTDFDYSCKGKETVGGVILNREKILSLNPDIIIMQEDAQAREISVLRKAGLNILSVRLTDFESLFDSINIIGEAMGVSEKAEEIEIEMRNSIASMEAKLFKKRKRVFFLLNIKPIITCGNKSFLNKIIFLAGGENAASDINKYYPRISFEKLLDYDPEVIIVSEKLINKGYFRSTQPWKMLSAVKNNNVKYINDDLIVRLSPRIIDGIKYLESVLYQ